MRTARSRTSGGVGSVLFHGLILSRVEVSTKPGVTQASGVKANLDGAVTDTNIAKRPRLELSQQDLMLSVIHNVVAIKALGIT